MELKPNGINIILSILTGLVHILIGLNELVQNGGFLNLMLLLDGIGFIGLTFGYYMSFEIKSESFSFISDNKEMFLFGYMFYTFISFISYFLVWGFDGLTNLTGMITKLIEIALLFSLNQTLRESNETT